MTEYLKIVPLPSWWQKIELNDLSISELFEDLLSWNSESKLITPRYITCTYFGTIVTIFNFIFFHFVLFVLRFFNPERASKAGHFLVLRYNLENEKVMVHNNIYSHIESYKYLNWNHMKVRKGKCFLDTISGARNLDDTCIEL